MSTRQTPSHEEAPVEIAEYDPAWPALFEAEAATLRLVLDPWLTGPIEHIGSTAVPGLAAKPVIDIMAGVTDLLSSEPARLALQRVGYQYSPYRPGLMHWFCKPGFAFRTHHLHLVPYGNRLWQERLLFRDALRASPTLVRDYAALKKDLARKHRLDREAYTEAKDPFVTQVLNRYRTTDT